MDRFSSRHPGPSAGKPCPFCAIARGEAPAWIVAEDDAVVAFLDRSPLLRGHVLLIPRVHVETLPEADDATLQRLTGRLRDLAAAVPAALQAEGSFIAQNNVISQSVPHLHFHVVPRWKGDKLFARNLTWQRTRYADGEADEVAGKIRDALNQG
jgi:histidine triad (HIT) family protein